ncbi:nitric-oxide reductase large subunit [Bacteriovorax sp. PP10]|uniref:Nitric-oxide reductase large subunit n=1 Tax=Bacteriovorax antarcticus TaxID=3088717 RepID=A0ABU5VPY5_9BACT|nr:nitric-oxide reductase large subunit [Bacteriovorax sp. PP10]MEA9355101.1 nitric-oxide reductase large subunit [Bacteriovorax sp. PP10]
MKVKNLWIGLFTVIFLSFVVLLYYGKEIYFNAPPVPNKIITSNDKVLFTKSDIQYGQNIWQAMGGQEVGSIWGHGAYVAPDWSADWLHREAIFILDLWAQREFHTTYISLNEEQKAILQTRLALELRKNSLDNNGDMHVSADRALAIESVESHYVSLFSDDPALHELREAYALPKNIISDKEKIKKLTKFFFWSSWAASTNRPGDNISYTNNWPHEKLVNNVPTSSLIIWTGVSVIVLLMGIGLLAYYYAHEEKNEFTEETLPAVDPFLNLTQTPSMKATLKYFWIVTALMVFQIIMGIVTAHFGVEGTGFYGFPLADYLPYAVTRTWHIQVGIFWIATSWLATGLYIAPAISGYEPKFQRLGVNFLFISLLIIVVGSSTGEYLGVMEKMGVDVNFWFGHQGLEYVDLGRFWQIYLFIGLWLWFALVLRAILPAIKKDADGKNLLILFLISCGAIALFYGAGLMWGKHTNLAIIEYWRWWVVHLWVEGFFEVFATVVIAFLFVRMKILRASMATATVLFSTIVFLFGGILGTFHHLYFSGTPIGVLAIGSAFSALEVVPLVLIGFEAYQNVRLSRSTNWLKDYKWPIYCFISVAFWNFLGAGIFGFVINPPIALYYMQGLNTTPLHGHTALFGVYGMLGIGLMLFCLKTMGFKANWESKLLGSSLWMINIGLFLMAFLSLLPVGMLQTIASVEHGLWYARSAEFMQTDLMNTLRWLRVPGDTIFGIGACTLAYFITTLRRS